MIKNKYKNKSQHIESLKRQMHENPEKFKQMLAEKEQELKQEEKKIEDEKVDEKSQAGEDPHPDPTSQASARSKTSAPKQKRPPMDKQEAYLEFKKELGKPIENSII